MAETFLRKFRKYDPMYLLCDSLFGEHHPRWVRALMGLVVMTTGVIIAKTGAHLGEYEVVHVIFDEVGYAIHAMGATPYIEGAVMYMTSVRAALTGAAIVVAVPEAEEAKDTPGA